MTLPVWTIWCFRVAPGHRGQGVARALLEGAVEFAREHGAPAVEGYPVDNQGRKVDSTMAYVGTRSLFEAAGFTLASPDISNGRRFSARGDAPRAQPVVIPLAGRPFQQPLARLLRVERALVHPQLQQEPVSLADDRARRDARATS